MAAVRYFDAEKAAAYVSSIKWPNGPVCEKCGSVNVGYISSRARYQCREKGCRKQFSLTTGTIFESTHLPLEKWCVAVWMILNCRNGVSSCEIARTIGCKQQSAWHVLHRVRAIIAQCHDGKLSGTIEADATVVGGLLKNMHEKKRATIGKRANKTIVHAVRERESGQIRANVIGDESTDTLRAMIAANVEPGSRLTTDAWPAYRRLRDTFDHDYVSHMDGEYVRGDVHTNGCENFFNCLRRALKGTYIKATPKHLDAYVNEAVYRFNIRRDSEWERFDGAMRRIVGKRLTYSELTDGATR
jgi:transposase-like protein/IS1 family transposase